MEVQLPNHKPNKKVVGRVQKKISISAFNHPSINHEITTINTYINGGKKCHKSQLLIQFANYKKIIVKHSLKTFNLLS